MIAYISGTVLHVGTRGAIIETGGIGYHVFATPETLATLREGKTATLWTHHAVREDSEDLFGFEMREELSIFELLLGVSGIGPKSALNILAVTTIPNLRRAITSGESAHLVKVGGIGRKTAEKIILELREKLGAAESGEGEMLQEEVDALEALRSIGYSQGEARDAIKKVPKEIIGTGERVKHALKTLGK